MKRSIRQRSDVVIKWPRDPKRIGAILRSGKLPSHARPKNAKQGAVVAVTDPNGVVQLVFRLKEVVEARSVVLANGKLRPWAFLLVSAPGTMRRPARGDRRRLTVRPLPFGAIGYFEHSSGESVWYGGKAAKSAEARPPRSGDLTRRGPVCEAMRECDRLGRKRFLRKHGFGPAKRWFVLFDGKQYDSKAIAGVAMQKQYGTRVGASDFTGGARTVVPQLERLGFRVVSSETTDATVALPEEHGTDFEEGARRAVQVNRYERDPAARVACLAAHGTACVICGFSFGEAYGGEFTGHIHVHHVRPMSRRRRRHRVDPSTDLVPVCPNCHAAIHYRGACRSIGAVRRLIQRARGVAARQHEEAGYAAT
jgi:5-methylcytosine-specific restriction protein A